MGGLLFSCENEIEKVKVFASNEETPVEVGENVELIYSDSAIIKMKLNATRLESYDTDSPYVEMKDGVQVIFYDKYGDEESRLTSEYAIRRETGGIMEARNDVVVINKNGETLNTEHLIWDENTEKITTNEFVKITTEDEIIYGDGLEANQDFTKYKIMNIKGTIQIKEEPADSAQTEAPTE